MRCPKCGSNENISFFLRHQKDGEDDESTIANCITIIHAEKECGYNQSFLLVDCLEDIFPDWRETPSFPIEAIPSFPVEAINQSEFEVIDENTETEEPMS